MPTEALNGSSPYSENGQFSAAALEYDRNDANDGNDTGHASSPSKISERVYGLLPRTIGEVVRHVDPGHERDLVLTGLLPVCAGAMPNVLFRYGNQWQSLNLYVAAIAPPGSGKGKFRIAKRCGKKLDERLYEESRQEIDRWESRRGEEEHDVGERPPERTLFLPGDSSAAAMKRAIEANPHGVMFETEIKTVGTALSQDWGDFREVLLKAFHNESVAVSRRRDDLLRIDHPSLSVALSGTPSTLTDLIEGIEDGLFSRFCFYAFDGELEWVPQFTDDRDAALDKAVETAAGRLDGLHRSLTGRLEPLYISFPRRLRKVHTSACKAALGGVKAEEVPEKLVPNVKRAGVNALRIASIFALLRLEERAADLSGAQSIEISEADLQAGLYLAFTYLSHALQVAGQMESASFAGDLNEERRAYLDALPDGSFSTGKAKEVASDIGMTSRTAQRNLDRFAEKGFVVDVAHGQWRRPLAKRVAGVISVEAVLSVIFDQDDKEPNDRPSIEEEVPF
jgi:hypothetical protein